MQLLTETRFRRELRALLDTWQGKVLATAEGRLLLCVESMLAHAYADAFHTLLQAVRPDLWDADTGTPRPPFLTSIGTIDHAGRVTAKLLQGHGHLPHEWVIYKSAEQYRDALRRLADRLKLADDDRKQFFTCASNWLAADRRVDPNTGERALVH